MRRAAAMGDGWHPVGAIPAAPLEPEELAKNIFLLHRYAEDNGRAPSELEVSMKAPLYDVNTTPPGASRRRFSGTTEEMLQDIQIYEEIGVSCIIFDIRGNDLNRSLERLHWFAEEIMERS